MDWNREKYRVWMIFLNGNLNLVRLSHSGCLLMFRKPLLVGCCIVIWILFGAFSIFSVTKKLPPFFTPVSADKKQDGRKKRTAKRLCDGAITCMFCPNLHL